MMKSTPASTAQPTCSSNMARTVRCESSSPTNTFVLQMFPANSAPLSSATSFGDRQRLPVHLLQQVLLADHSQLFAMRVVGEGLDHVRPGMDELAVELRHEIRMLQDHLGHIRPRLQVAAPLELEEIPFGADDRPRPRAVPAGPVGVRPVSFIHLSFLLRHSGRAAAGHVHGQPRLHHRLVAEHRPERRVGQCRPIGAERLDRILRLPVEGELAQDAADQRGELEGVAGVDDDAICG